MTRRSFVLLVVACAIVSLTYAAEYKTEILTPSSESLLINVPEHHFLRIRSFRQQGGSERGVATLVGSSALPEPTPTPAPDETPTPSVTPTPTPPPQILLTATLIGSGVDPDDLAAEPESAKGIVVAGPAQVEVEPVSGATLFITYRKISEPTPTPSPTATTTPPTPTPTTTPTP
jgi:hypothetical protein